MSLKKSWFGYGVWAVYSVIVCIFLATYINAQCIVLKAGKNTTIFIVCLAFACIFGTYLLLRMAYQKWGGKIESISAHSKMLFEIFLVLSLFCGAVLIRIYWYMHQYSEPFGTQQFYEMAVVKEGNGIPAILHGASYLYTGILSLLFSLFGNKQTAGIVLQLILQLFGILFFYFAIRNLTGKTEAVLSLAILAFFPAMLTYNFTLMPENLYFFLFAQMLFGISLYKKYEEKKERKTAAALVCVVLLGIGAGYMLYLDAAGILLFLAVLFVVLAKKRKKGKNAVYTGAAVIGILVSVLLLFLTEALLTNETIFQTAGTWWNLYFQKFAVHFQMAGPDLTIAGSIIGCALAAWYAVGFLQEEQKRGGIYMLSLVLILLMVSFGTQNMSYQILATAYWSVLAALGVTAVLGRKNPAAVIEKQEETVIKEASIKVTSMEETSMKEADMEEMEIEEFEINELEINEPKPKKQVQFIENPLPLPKKHVKKTMEYKIEPEARLMKYDIDIKNDDDFDLK